MAAENLARKSASKQKIAMPKCVVLEQPRVGVTINLAPEASASAGSCRPSLIGQRVEGPQAVGAADGALPG